MDNNENQSNKPESGRPNHRRPRGRYNNNRRPQSHGGQPNAGQSNGVQPNATVKAEVLETPSNVPSPNVQTSSPSVDSPVKQPQPGRRQFNQNGAQNGQKPRPPKPKQQFQGQKNNRREDIWRENEKSEPHEMNDKSIPANERNAEAGESRQGRPKVPYNRRNKNGRREQNREKRVLNEIIIEDDDVSTDANQPEPADEIRTEQISLAAKIEAPEASSDVKTSDVKTSDVKTSDIKTSDSVSPEIKPPANLQAADTKDTELSERIAGDVTAADEAEPVDGKPDVPFETEIIGVRFKKSGKIYYFDPSGFQITKDDDVIVETARGIEYGSVTIENRMVRTSHIVLPLRKVIRVATPEDRVHREENVKRETEAYNICIEKIEAHKLQMKLVDVEYTFDSNKLLFYFTADGRIDFRDLVKDLASVFRTRIELRQIGIRDEAKMMGGLGICGRPFCCHSFLADFVQVSIKMAKEQNLSLNSSKISGACGRLMCCLRYEYDTYDEEIRKTPPLESTVRTPDGEGIVIEINPLAGLVKVRLKNPESPVKTYKREDVVKLKNAPPIIRREPNEPDAASNDAVSDVSDIDSASADGVNA